MSENQTTMAPQAEGQVPEFQDIAEKGLVLTGTKVIWCRTLLR
jgi:hypothetical protein